MDLTADKVLVAGVLVAMVEVGLLPTWIVALLLVRELAVQGVRQVAASADVVIAARWLGKGKTAATNLGMAILLLSFDAATDGPLAATGLGPALRTAGAWIMVLATVLSVVSGWGYVRGALPLLLGRSATGADRPT
jgi:CDP-diacylglycerol--glycerol-3-phosphate 3-phosphatidyltransferase